MVTASEVGGCLEGESGSLSASRPSSISGGGRGKLGPSSAVMQSSTGGARLMMLSVDLGALVIETKF